ncbi:hypothetical protein [Andreprevotia chitinilytica]|uniref:hypothetical protein n=1 Tax=Andreprevotia chitinilytica TaxID=396808 RepID=UPI000555F038|nr:hypothetical protein [Andreprevotia chitinilytica]
MLVTDAKVLIESFANGVDPETGEVLAESSVLNQPRVIRALFVASRALEQLGQHDNGQRINTKTVVEREKPENAGKAWSDEEDQALLAGFDDGLTAKELAQHHGRSLNGINAWLVRLGRIQERVEVRTGS